MAITGYRIVRKIRQGGMSTVYLAIQKSVDREVALKVMSPSLNVGSNFSTRFYREAKIVGQLSHPNIVSIYDVGSYKQYNYIAMDYLPGRSLQDRLEKGVSVSLALKITQEIASALDYAHELGYVHRDIKPDNILFRANDSAVLCDFGIAKSLEGSVKMTRAGAVLGTPHYMSPEQVQGKDVDGRADLYSLGTVLFEMLTGEVPFTGEDAVSVAIKHVSANVPKLPTGKKKYQPIINRLLAKKANARYQTGKELINAINTLQVSLNTGSSKSLINTDYSKAVKLFNRIISLIASTLSSINLFINRAIFRQRTFTENTIELTEHQRNEMDSFVLNTNPPDLDTKIRVDRSSFSSLSQLFQMVQNNRSSLPWLYWSIGIAVLIIGIFIFINVQTLEQTPNFYTENNTPLPKIKSEADKKLFQSNRSNTEFKNSQLVATPNVRPIIKTNPVIRDKPQVDTQTTAQIGTINNAYSKKSSVENNTPVTTPAVPGINTATTDSNTLLEEQNNNPVIKQSTSTPSTELSSIDGVRDNNTVGVISTTSNNIEDSITTIDKTASSINDVYIAAAQVNSKAEPIIEDEQPQKKPKEKLKKKITYGLTISVTPPDAKIQILNIKPVYKPDIQLQPGSYRINVSAKGYAPKKFTVDITNRSRSYSIELTPERRLLRPGDIIVDNLAIGGKGAKMIVLPQKTIAKLVSPIAAGQYEITYEQYDQFARNAGRPLPQDYGWGRGKRPVIGINMWEAQAFAKWMSEQTGKNYRLPTQHEWEAITHSLQDSKYWWGNFSLKERANCRKGCNSQWSTLFNSTTAPVGSYQANKNKLYDVMGNVSEWLSDCIRWQDDNKKEVCLLALAAGGSHQDEEETINEDAVIPASAGEVYNTIGLRLVLDL